MTTALAGGSCPGGGRLADGARRVAGAAATPAVQAGKHGAGSSDRTS